MQLHSSIKQKMNFSMMSRVSIRIHIFLIVLLLGSLTFEVKVKAASYAVMDEIYPFMPPQQLLEEIEELLEMRENVCISVMPVCQNTDYPAFAEFVNVLQYAQQRGCHILIHFPLIQTADPEAGEIAAIIRDNVEQYESMSVYPEGILYDGGDEYLDLVEALEEYYPVFNIQKDEMTLAATDRGTCPVLETERLAAVKYTYKENVVDGNYDYHRDVIDNVSVSLEKSNRVLLLIVCMAVLIFTGMIVYARRLNYREFIGAKKDTSNKEEREEGGKPT